MLMLLNESLRPHGDWAGINANSVAGRVLDATVSNIPYIGGMPCGITANGMVAGATALGGTTSAVDSNNILGLMWNNSVIDSARGSGSKNGVTDRTQAIPSVVLGPCLVRLFSGAQQNDAAIPTIGGAPFKADGWLVNDYLYICSGGAAADAGKWTKTAGSANFQRPFGKVIGVTASGGVTTELLVDFWGFIPGATTTVIPT